MQLYKYLPLASDRMGALWALSTIRDSCILEYGPAGTTHYGIEGFMQLNAEMKSRLFTTHMDETDIVMGDSTRLEKTIHEIDQVYSPRVIFVVASSISSIIGTDIETICALLQPETTARLVAVTGGGFRGDFTLGIREVLTALAQKLVEAPQKKLPKTYNIIGATADCYNFLSDIRELKSVMSECFGCSANTVFTIDSSVDEIAGAAKAAFNIVLRAEGVDCAEILKQKYGSPYIYGSPYGYRGTIDWLQRVEEATGLTCDARYLQQVSATAQRYVMGVRRALFNYKTLSCVVSGNYDQARGLASFVKNELGLDVRKVIVNHSRPPEVPELSPEWASLVVFNPGEDYKEELMGTDTPAVLFGDGILLEMGHGVPIQLQVANPNLYTTQIFDGTPFMGPRGATYIIERLLNGIRHNGSTLRGR